MVDREFRFQHGSKRLPSGKFVGEVTFVDERSQEVSITYPEQFDSAEAAAAHAYRGAVLRRGLPEPSDRPPPSVPI